MSTIWRIALAWMLALSLPLQGHAAQRLLASAASPAAASAEVLGPLAAPQGREAPIPGSHEGLTDPHARHCDKASAAAGAEAAKPGSTGSCSACASCCHAAALPPTVPQLPLMPPAMPEAPEIHLTLAFVWLDGLERPPRPAQR
ncbi:hypothetical protein H5407_02950 [Mitsuaria sp. WAJ17]|uniref:hypothetical protein n=1 Tax=Mitsuaria sp. WAJ17 TaxID=2761452 RepID=UPI0015FFBE17|nr:hypothetical protein [Mitsuaria sp. WAJ17]MBB2484178.1 hypothetical protein [Mitsuaria sp. WAJ17]